MLQVHTADGTDGCNRFALLSELKTAAEPNRDRVLTARWGQATEWDETEGLCFAMLYCSAEDKQKELGGPVATNAASPRLHPPAVPALIGS